MHYIAMSKVNVNFRKVLVSSGVFTPEVIMSDGIISVHESSPEGLTVGLKEKQRGAGELPNDFVFNYEDVFSQESFDTEIAEKYDGEISTALSLAFLRYTAATAGKTNLYEHISHSLKFNEGRPH